MRKAVFILSIMYFSSGLISCGTAENENENYSETENSLPHPRSLETQRYRGLSEAEKKPKTITKKQATTEMVEMRMKLGMIKKLDVDANEAWISLNSWTAMNAQGKESFVADLAHYCGDRGSTYHVTLYDAQSGKKLATYSRAWGYKVY